MHAILLILGAIMDGSIGKAKKLDETNNNIKIFWTNHILVFLKTFYIFVY